LKIPFFIMVCLCLFELNSVIGQETVYITNKGIARKREFKLQIGKVQTIRMNEEFSVKAELMVMDTSGCIYAANRAQGAVLYFNSHGEFIRMIGARGREKKQYQYIKSMGVSAANGLVLLDSFRRKTISYDSTGVFRKEAGWSLPRNLYLDHVLFAGEADYIAVQREAYMGVSRKLECQIVSFSNEGRKNWESPLMSDGELRVREMAGNRSEISLVSNAVQAVFCCNPGKKLIHVVNGDRYLISTFSFYGKLIRKISRPYERVRLWVEQDGRRQVSGYKNVAVRTLIDTDNNLWVKTNEIRVGNDGETAAWDVFNMQGQYVYRFWLSVDPQIITSSQLYTINFNGDIVRYEYVVGE